jgi:hypothetical protein
LRSASKPAVAGAPESASYDDAQGVAFDGRPSVDSPLGWLQLPEQWLRHRLAVSSYRRRVARNRRDGQETVFVFCHPRVGSKSLYLTLEATPGISPIHLHAITETHSRFRFGQPIVSNDGVACNSAARALVARAHIDAVAHQRFVVSLRDPIAVNVSFFVFWGRKYWFRDAWNRAAELDDAALERLFVERFPHRSMLRWLDLEFTPATGLDTRTLAFDATRGAGIVAGARASALILRADIPDATKREELAAFLGRPVAEVARANDIGSRYPAQAGLMERLRRIVPGIPGYVDAILGSPFARRFWTGAQLETMRCKWKQRVHARPSFGG